MALATTAAIAGATAAAAYLNAKYHIRKDIVGLYRLKKMEKGLQTAIADDELNLFFRVERQCERLSRLEPHGEAIWSRTGCYTWAELYNKSLQYANFYLELGAKPKSLVGFYLTNSPEFMFAWMGLWAIGCAPAMINFHLGGEALVHCVKLTGVNMLLVDWDDDCRARVEGVRKELESIGVKIVILDDAAKRHIDSLKPTRPPDSYRRGFKPEDPGFLLYTSGSTGFPKAVAFNLGRCQSMGGPYANTIGVRGGPNGDRWYDCMPLYHGTGGVVSATCMLEGITLCIGKKFSTSRFWQDIRDSKATAFVYVGETARYLLAAPASPRDKDHNVKVMFGNGMRPDVWLRFVDRFGIQQVSEFFNSTEGVFGLLTVSRGPFLATSVGHHGAILRFLMRNYYVVAEIDHETGDLWRDPKTGFGKRNKLEDGGEALVGVPDESLFSGYWNNDSATRKKFVRDLFKKGDLWYRSGDALRRDKDGRWYFMDRLGDTYRWKSENVATAEVSEALGHSPEIAEAIVYGVHVPGHDGRAGCAAIHLNAGISPTPALFRNLLHHGLAKLPRYAVPVFIRLLPSFRAMHNNKQEKVPLKKDGIDLDAIYGPGQDAKDALQEGKDVIYWWPGALGSPTTDLNGDGYVLFERKDWEGLKRETHIASRL